LITALPYLYLVSARTLRLLWLVSLVPMVLARLYGLQAFTKQNAYSNGVSLWLTPFYYPPCFLEYQLNTYIYRPWRSV
jgi:hypothetical protein